MHRSTKRTLEDAGHQPSRNTLFFDEGDKALNPLLYAIGNNIGLSDELADLAKLSPQQRFEKLSQTHINVFNASNAFMLCARKSFPNLISTLQDGLNIYHRYQLLEQVDGLGSTALMIAVECGNSGAFYNFLQGLPVPQRAALLMQQNRFGETCLMLAARHYRREIFAIALAYQPQDTIFLLLNQTNKYGETVFMEAVAGGDSQLVEDLLSKLTLGQINATVNRKNKHGQNAVQIASSNHHQALAIMLNNYINAWSPVFKLNKVPTPSLLLKLTAMEKLQNILDDPDNEYMNNIPVADIESHISVIGDNNLFGFLQRASIGGEKLFIAVIKKCNSDLNKLIIAPLTEDECFRLLSMTGIDGCSALMIMAKFGGVRQIVPILKRLSQEHCLALLNQRHQNGLTAFQWLEKYFSLKDVEQVISRFTPDYVQRLNRFVRPVKHASQNKTGMFKRYLGNGSWVPRECFIKAELATLQSSYPESDSIRIKGYCGQAGSQEKRRKDAFEKVHSFDLFQDCAAPDMNNGYKTNRTWVDRCLVVESEFEGAKKIIGAILFSIHLKSRECVLDSFEIAEEHKGNQLGGKLLLSAVATALCYGCTKIECDSTNEARGFYLHYGFNLNVIDDSYCLDFEKPEDRNKFVTAMKKIGATDAIELMIDDLVSLQAQQSGANQQKSVLQMFASRCEIRGMKDKEESKPVEVYSLRRE